MARGGEIPIELVRAIVPSKREKGKKMGNLRGERAGDAIGIGSSDHLHRSDNSDESGWSLRTMSGCVARACQHAVLFAAILAIFPRGVRPLLADPVATGAHLHLARRQFRLL